MSVTLPLRSPGLRRGHLHRRVEASLEINQLRSMVIGGTGLHLVDLFESLRHSPGLLGVRLE